MRLRMRTIGLLGMVAALALTACGGDDDAPTPLSTATRVPQSTAVPTDTSTPIPVSVEKRGGTLTVGSVGAAPNLDINGRSSLQTILQIGSAYNGLVETDPLDNTSIIPGLAERWELSSDGKTYTFHLRNNVRWHDGQPFVAEDVKFSLERSLEKVKGYAGKWLASIEEITVVNPTTVQIQLQSPQLSLLGALAVPSYGGGSIVPKHVLDEDPTALETSVVGTGPFKLTRYERGVEALLERNDDYWVSGRPYLDAVLTIPIPDASTRLSAFIAGRVDMLSFDTPMTPQEAQILRQRMPKASVVPFDRLNVMAMSFNPTEGSPWADVRVRKAAYLAVDRQQLISGAGGGEGKLAVTLLPEEYRVSEQELSTWPGFRQPKQDDIAEAKRLLVDAGYQNGFDFTLMSTSRDPIFDDVALILQQQLGQIGLNMTVESPEWGAYVDRYRKNTWVTKVSRCSMFFPDPDASAMQQMNPPSCLTGMQDPKLLDIAKRQTQAATGAERKALLIELQKHVAEEVPHLVAFYTQFYLAHWPAVMNWEPQPGLIFNSRYQDVWLDR